MTENNKINHLNGTDSWKRNFYILFTGQQLSTFTSMIVQYALIWYLTDKSKSPTILAISTIMAFLPGIFISPFIGPLIDRINKKILLIASDWIVAFSAIILALIGQGGNLPFWMICLALFIRSLAGTVQTPTTQSIIPTLVPEDFVPKVGGLNGAFSSASMLVTPAIGAFFYGIMPISQIMLIDVLGAIFGTIAVLMIKIVSFQEENKNESYIKELVEGFNLVRSNKSIFQFTIIITLIMMFSMPGFSLYPLITTEHFKGTISDASYIEVAWAAGSLIGGAIIGLVGNTKKRLTKGVLWFTLAGISFIIMGLLPGDKNNLWYFLALQVPAGIGYMAANGLFISIVQQAYPAEQTGRVMSISMSLTSLASPIGLIFAGPAAEKIGIPALLIISGASILLGNIFCLKLPKVKQLDYMEIKTNAGSFSEENID